MESQRPNGEAEYLFSHPLLKEILDQMEGDVVATQKLSLRAVTAAPTSTVSNKPVFGKAAEWICLALGQSPRISSSLR